MIAYLTQLLHSLPAGIGAMTVLGIVLAVVARFLPNDKLFAFGYKMGTSTTIAATLKFGTGWQRIEDFFVNSFGQVISGFKAGLLSDDGESTQSSNTGKKKPDVRI